MSLSTQTIVGQVTRSAPRGDRIESNWTGVSGKALGMKGAGGQVQTEGTQTPRLWLLKRVTFQKKKRANVAKL